MKKHAWKLITLLAIVALLVTGVVFAVSAETESETPAVYKQTSYKSEYVAASGSAAPAGWQINSVTPSGNLPAGAEYWDGNGNGLWVDFEYYYDSAYVKSATTIRMGGSTKGAIISISGGRITTTTNMAVGEKTVATLTTSGWHHIQAKITQEYDATNGANLYYVQIWLNGVDCGTYQGKTSAWDANGWKLFTATPAGDGSVTYARASGYLYLYGDKIGTTAGRFIYLRNVYGYVGNTARVNYKPISFVGSSAMTYAYGSELTARNDYGTFVAYDEYKKFPIIDWQNFVNPAAALSDIAIPALTSGDAWYSDPLGENAITSLKDAVKRPDGSVALYARYVSSAGTLDSWQLASGEYTNPNDDIWQGANLGSQSRVFENGESYSIAFDYYYDPDETNSGILDIRLRRKDAASAPFHIAGDVISAYDEYFVEGGKSRMYSEVCRLEGTGWHRIVVSMTQVTDEANGYKHTYTLSISVDGGESYVYTPTEHAVETFWESEKYQLALYQNAYDEKGNWIGYKKLDGGSIRYYFYGSDFYWKNDGSTDASEHMLLIRNAQVCYGRGYDGSAGISKITYELNGGRMPTELLDTAKADHFTGTGVSYTPLTDKNGNALVYDYFTNKVYYSASSTYALPIPTKVGQSFAGWYLSDDFSGEPVTDTSAFSGDVTLYAKFVGGSYTVTLNENGTETVYENCESITLPTSAEYWISGGEMIAGGTTLTLEADASFIALSADLLTGASIRLREQSGVRFHTAISKDLLAALSEMGMTSYKLGTVITVSDLLSGEFTAEALTTAGIPYVELTSDDEGVVLDDDGISKIFYASIVDIIEQNFTREFTAISYLEFVMGGTVYRFYTDYNSGDNTRSVYEVAKAANADTEASYTDTQKAQLKTYIDGVLSLNVTLKDGALSKVTVVAPYSGYKVAYTVRIDPATATITLTKPADVELVTVLLKVTSTDIYTSGWTVSEDGTTVTIQYGTPTATE